MKVQWRNSSFPGVRYYEHHSRKHGINPDRNFVIRYRFKGKRYEEPVGWASKGWSARKAANELAKLKEAHTTGQGPVSLAEKREQEKKRREEQKAEKTRLEKENITLETFYTDTYSPVAATSKKKLSCDTEDHLYRNWIKPAMGKLPIRDITPFHIEKLKKKMLDAEKTPRTLQYAFAIIRQVWNTARRANLVSGDTPTLNVKIPKIDNRRLRFLSQEEAHTLLYGLAWRSEQLYNIALLSLHTGMRAGEIFSLTWGRIDFTRGLISIVDAKAVKTRTAYMTAQVKSMLQGLYGKGKDQNALVFPNRDGERIKEVSQSFDRAVTEIGFNKGIEDPRQRVVFHSLRHTFAGWLVENGTDLYTVKELMGHSTISMTERYSHLGENTLQGAVKNLEKSMQANNDQHLKEKKKKKAGGASQ